MGREKGREEERDKEIKEEEEEWRAGKRGPVHENQSENHACLREGLASERAPAGLFPMGCP